MSKKKNKAAAPTQPTSSAGTGDQAAQAVSVAAHPRARASIRRTRARTALVAFAIVLYLSLSSGVPGEEAAVRALIAGLVGNLMGWACALVVWRALVLAEIKVVGEARRERRRAGAVAAEKADKAASTA
jgi:type VI protein secretion system component VasK